MTFSDMFLAIKNHSNWMTAEDESHRIEWYTSEWDGFNCLAFQESNGWKDWKDNFNILPSKTLCCAGQVVMSKGTDAAYKVGREAIRADYLKLAGNGKPWAVFGWSHGGGMAIRGVVDLNHTFGIKPDLVTFGSPAVLWGQNSRAHVYNCVNRVFQWAHRSDIVTRVAPGASHVEVKRIGVWFPFAECGVAKWHTEYDKWCDGWGNLEIR